MNLRLVASPFACDKKCPIILSSRLDMSDFTLLCVRSFRTLGAKVGSQDPHSLLADPHKSQEWTKQKDLEWCVQLWQQASWTTHVFSCQNWKHSSISGKATPSSTAFPPMSVQRGALQMGETATGDDTTLQQFNGRRNF